MKKVAYKRRKKTFNNNNNNTNVRLIVSCIACFY